MKEPIRQRRGQEHIARICLLLALAVSASAQEAANRLSSYANPFIGTRVDKPNSLSGSTFLGPTVPFGFVQFRQK